MPSYIGSIKTMVVAAFEGAYGQAEQVTAVREPLMVLGTLPRVLGPEEELKLPVTLFAGDASVKVAKVEVKVSGPINLQGSTSRQVSFEGKSDLTTYFDLSVMGETGVGKVTIVATSGSHSTQHEIEVAVRNPLLPVTKIIEGRLEAGQSWETAMETFGVAGSSSAVLEVSSIPPINLDARLAYLLSYPHGCLEQLTSAAFPQLYVSELQTLSEAQSKRMQDNIKTAVQKLVQLQNRDGGFRYWPGAVQSDYWSTTYAGHFLVEAQRKGYVVPSEVIRRWKRFQKSTVSDWRKDPQSTSGDLQQAYRLYALAVSGSPENGAMNRLRESPNLQQQASWMLAAAYATVGQKEAARQLISPNRIKVESYSDPGDTYGSSLRDQAILLETLALLEDESAGLDLLQEISKALSNSDFWMSTQTTAFCLKAVALFTKRIAKVDELIFTFSQGTDKAREARTSLPMASINLDVKGRPGQILKLQNQSNGVLFTRVMLSGTPARPDEDFTIERNLRIQAIYTDSEGHPVNINQVEQGTSFYSEITVMHLGLGLDYKNLALSQIFPSGWEINNYRLDPVSGDQTVSNYDYQDIRDDRVLTYFDLKPGQLKVFRTLITAAYAGKYYLPGPHCEAMYDHNIQARTKGMEVQVTESKIVY
ncbi:MAG: hypothetical protein IPL46_15830 [Saprospiraceae bacterium]|nr:hypothetical protein [Saprospiraceae bacterium]